MLGVFYVLVLLLWARFPKFCAVGWEAPVGLQEALFELVRKCAPLELEHLCAWCPSLVQTLPWFPWYFRSRGNEGGKTEASSHQILPRAAGQVQELSVLCLHTGGSSGTGFSSLWQCASWILCLICKCAGNLQNFSQILTGCFHCPTFRTPKQKISTAGTQHNWNQIIMFYSTSRLIIQLFSLSLMLQSLITGRLFFT